ncbi:hypothetical protein FPV67DRAFT_1578220 [Lyophyllum atratum]|nr:hypothetical protein FPV67DRAFT_1578220 [Lyophyllum atratum]
MTPDELEPLASFPGPATTSSPSQPQITVLSFAPLPTPSVPDFSHKPLTLIFHPDHPCSTQITDVTTKEVLYMVETEIIHEPPMKKRTVTTVRRPNTETAIAQFQWRDFFTSDSVALTRSIAGSIAEKEGADGNGFGKSGEGLITMSASAWLKKSSVPFKDTVKYKDPERKWKGFAPGLSLELYSSEYPNEALVKFHKSRRFSASKTSTTTRVIEAGGIVKVETKVRSETRNPARLTIDPSVVRAGLLDEVVVTFLYLEKVRRERDDDKFKVIPKTPPEAPKRRLSSRSQGMEQLTSSSSRPTPLK